MTASRVSSSRRLRRAVKSFCIACDAHYDADVRTTVDLPEAILEQVKALAAERGASVSATLADLTARGLVELHGPMKIRIDERSGFPVLDFGRPVSSEDIATALEEG